MSRRGKSFWLLTILSIACCILVISVNRERQSNLAASVSFLKDRKWDGRHLSVGYNRSTEELYTVPGDRKDLAKQLDRELGSRHPRITKPSKNIPMTYEVPDPRSGYACQVFLYPTSDGETSVEVREQTDLTVFEKVKAWFGNLFSGRSRSQSGC